MKHFYFFLLFFICNFCVYAGRVVEPTVWHKPQIIGERLQIKDTMVPATERYTMMMVYQNPKPDTALQLWQLNIKTNKYWQMTTYGLGNQRSKAKIKPSRGIKTPCIYTAQQTVKKHDQDFSLAFADTAVKVYEVAYFSDYMSVLQKRMCQTYLAIKYGITLDTVEYIAPSGDTIWRADDTDLDFFHRIHGIGKFEHTTYNIDKTEDFSFEDSIIRLSKMDMADNFYAVVGDDDGDLTWAKDELQEDNSNTLGRNWRLKTSSVGQGMLIQIDIDTLMEDSLTADSLQKTVHLLLDDEEVVSADSVHEPSAGRRWLCFTLKPKSAALNFTLVRMLLPEPKENADDETTSDETTNLEPPLATDDGFSVYLSPNPTSGEFQVHITISQPTEMSVVVRDATGKIVTQTALGKITNYSYHGSISVAGVYFVEVQDRSGKTLSINKLIVQ